MTEYEKGYKDGMAGAALPNIIDNGDKIDGYAYSYKTDSDGVPYINIDCVRAMLTKAADHRQLAEWLTELKELEAKHWDECRQIAHYDDELKEAKRLLKAAVDDIYKARQGCNCNICDMPPEPTERCQYENGEDCQFKWRYADEALKLIGGNENG